MEALTIREILEAVNGRLLGDFDDLDKTVSVVETDSRSISEGALFLPLSGDRFDGHAYISSALEAGAAGCLTQRERESYLPGKFYIKVDSTHRALRDLAVWYKNRFDIPVQGHIILSRDPVPLMPVPDHAGPVIAHHLPQGEFCHVLDIVL